MSDGALVGNAVEHYGRLCRGVTAVAFCAGVAHSWAVAERFNAARFRVAHVGGDAEKDEQRRRIEALGTGDLDVLTNAGLIFEDVDVPAIGAAVLLRPTKSLGLYLQQVGRALGPATGKDRAIVLHHAGNSLAHGLPDEARSWSLDDKPRRQRKGVPAKPRLCPACGTVNRPGAPTYKGCWLPARADPGGTAGDRRRAAGRLTGRNESGHPQYALRRGDRMGRHGGQAAAGREGLRVSPQVGAACHGREESEPAAGLSGFGAVP